MPGIVILLIIGVVLYLLLRSGGTYADDSDPEQKLLRLCLGNVDQAERLMELERRNSPKISRSEAARRASHSIRRDLK